MIFRALISGKPIDPILTVNDFTIHVKVHPRARRLTLRYNTKKSCFVATVPKRTSKKSIIEFVNISQDWMAQQQRAAPVIPAFDETSFMIEGKTRRINHVDMPGVKITLHDDTIDVFCRPERLKRALLRYTRQRAQDVIIPLAHTKAAQIGKTITDINFRDTTSRWGSCSHDGKLSFSWRLILAPTDVVDYVVAHEVAHLQHFDHSKDFWALCRALSVNYTSGKHWLQLNGQSLHTIDL